MLYQLLLLSSLLTMIFSFQTSDDEQDAIRKLKEIRDILNDIKADDRYEQDLAKVFLTKNILDTGIRHKGEHSKKAITNQLLRALKHENVTLYIFGESVSVGADLGKNNNKIVFHYIVAEWWNKTIGPIVNSYMTRKQIAVGGVSTAFFDTCWQEYLENDERFDVGLWEFNINDKDVDKTPFSYNASNLNIHLERFIRSFYHKYNKTDLIFAMFYHRNVFHTGQKSKQYKKDKKMLVEPSQKVDSLRLHVKSNLTSNEMGTKRNNYIFSTMFSEIYDLQRKAKSQLSFTETKTQFRSLHMSNMTDLSMKTSSQIPLIASNTKRHLFHENLIINITKYYNITTLDIEPFLNTSLKKLTMIDMVSKNHPSQLAHQHMAYLMIRYYSETMLEVINEILNKNVQESKNYSKKHNRQRSNESNKNMVDLKKNSIQNTTTYKDILNINTNRDNVSSLLLILNDISKAVVVPEALYTTNNDCDQICWSEVTFNWNHHKLKHSLFTLPSNYTKGFQRLFTGWEDIPEDRKDYTGGYTTTLPSQNLRVWFNTTKEKGKNTISLAYRHKGNNNKNNFTVEIKQHATVVSTNDIKQINDIDSLQVRVIGELPQGDWLLNVTTFGYGEIIICGIMIC